MRKHMLQLQRLLYSTNGCNALEDVVDCCREFPRFHQYVTTNWLPHDQLLAGFAQPGVKHFDNYADNHLEWYHHMITGFSRCL